MNRPVILLVLAVSLLAAAVPARAAEPAGPRLAISAFAGGESGVVTVDPMGHGLKVIVADPDYWGIGDRLSWSADGSALTFSTSGPFQGDPGGAYGTGWPLLALARPDSGSSRVFPRAFLNGGEPVLAPDGASAVFTRVKLVKTLPGRESYLFKASIWSLNVANGSVRRLTRWRVGGYLDPISFSPDGSSVVFEISDRNGRRVVAIDRASSQSHLLARLPDDAREPTYSPDGAKLAYVVERDMTPNKLPARPISELVVAAADGSEARLLLRTKGYVSFPSWDPSGSRLAFTRNPPAEATGGLEPEPGNKVMAINADGTCLTRVISDPDLTLGGVAWRPGVGRDAGPISCR